MSEPKVFGLGDAAARLEEVAALIQGAPTEQIRVVRLTESMTRGLVADLAAIAQALRGFAAPGGDA